MPTQSLIDAFVAANKRHTDAVAELVPLLVQMALASVAEVLPGADALVTNGEMNEDWAFTLRIQRVLDADAAVLYDVSESHGDSEVEATIDSVGVDYLDLLMYLTGDEYFGQTTIRSINPRS